MSRSRLPKDALTNNILLASTNFLGHIEFSFLCSNIVCIKYLVINLGYHAQ